MHPIDEILEERCPNLMKNKILWSLIRPFVFKIFKYHEAKKIVKSLFAIKKVIRALAYAIHYICSFHNEYIYIYKQ